MRAIYEAALNGDDARAAEIDAASSRSTRRLR